VEVPGNQDEKEKNAISLAYEGKSLREIAAAMGRSFYSLCHYRDTHPVFEKALSKARAEGWLLHADRLLTIVEDNPDRDPQLIKIMSNNIMWLLERIRPEMFGQQIQIHQTVTDVRQALEDAKKRVIDITPQLKQIVQPPNPLD
jgi:hypothetical protein